VTPTDELWIDMTQFDTEVADGIWDGDTPPADAPAWWSDVADLVRAAKGPADRAELAAEDDIVARMAAVLRDAPTVAASDDAPDGGNDADPVTTAPARAADSPDSLTDDTHSDDTDVPDDDTAPAPAAPAPPLRLVADTPNDLPSEAADDRAEAATNASGSDVTAPVTLEPTALETAGLEADADEPTVVAPAASAAPAPVADTHDGTVAADTHDGTVAADTHEDTDTAGKGATVVALPVAAATAVEADAARPAHAAPRRSRPRRVEADDGPRHLKAPGPAANGLRLVRRALAVKAVATTTAVAIGITAAAAATGVVVTVVDPPKRETPETTISVPVSAAPAPGDDAEGGSGGGSDSGSPDDVGQATTTVPGMSSAGAALAFSVPFTCALDFVPCSPRDTPVDGASTTTVPGQPATPAPIDVTPTTGGTFVEPTTTLPETPSTTVEPTTTVLETTTTTETPTTTTTETPPPTSSEPLETFEVAE
jgi:hypothetical protein